MENANFDYNISHNNHLDKDYECDKNYDINNIENYHVDGFSINPNNKKWEYNIYPDINNFFDYNKNSNTINASFPHNFFNNTENENIDYKKYDNYNEED